MNSVDMEEMEKVLAPHVAVLQRTLQDVWPDLDADHMLLHYLCLRLGLRPPTWWPAHVKRPIVSCQSRPTWEHGMSLMTGARVLNGFGGERGMGLQLGPPSPWHDTSRPQSARATYNSQKTAAVNPSRGPPSRDNAATPDLKQAYAHDEQRLQTATPSTRCETASPTMSFPDSRPHSATSKASPSRHDKHFLSDYRWRTEDPGKWPRCGPHTRPKSASAGASTKMRSRQDDQGQPEEDVLAVA